MRVESGVALKQFLEKGVLATMRRYPYVPGRVIEVESGGRVVGKARVLMVWENTEGARRLLVGLSGFSSLEEWEEDARRFFGSLHWFIVEVERVEGRG